MIFDSHTHLNLAAFDLDRDELIKKYLKEGIFLINVGTCFETSLKALQIALKYKNCFSSVGLHPSHTFPFKKDRMEVSSLEEKEEQFDENFISLLNNKKVIAIGECGLDYSYLKELPLEKQEEYKKRQKEEFIKQIKIANEKKLPMIFHVREMYLDVLEILKELNFKQKGVFHFFTGNIDDLKAILSEGYYVSFSSIITYSHKLDEVIKETPLDRLLVETDAPYVPPLVYKGKRNEPIYIKEVIKKIAEIKNLSFEDVENITFKNTLELFNLKI